MGTQTVADTITGYKLVNWIRAPGTGAGGGRWQRAGGGRLITSSRVWRLPAPSSLHGDLVALSIPTVIAPKLKYHNKCHRLKKSSQKLFKVKLLTFNDNNSGRYITPNKSFYINIIIQKLERRTEAGIIRKAGVHKENKWHCFQARSRRRRVF